MGTPAWAQDSRYDTVHGRWQHRHDLDRKISEWTATQDDKALMRSLQAKGVRAGAVLTAQDLVDDPHLAERDFLQEVERFPSVGPRAFAGRPFRIPGLPTVIRNVAAMGEHNEAVLREVAGLTQEEIRALAAEGVIADRPRAGERAP
jgi:formyl-CoA transferase